MSSLKDSSNHSSNLYSGDGSNNTGYLRQSREQSNSWGHAANISPIIHKSVNTHIGNGRIIRRVDPQCGKDRIIRVVEGLANNRSSNQARPCFPQPPPNPWCFAPPQVPGFCPPIPGFCPPMPGFCPPMPFPLPPRPPIMCPVNPCLIKKPCIVPGEPQKCQDSEQTPQFNNCNFYMSDPLQNTGPQNVPPCCPPFNFPQCYLPQNVPNCCVPPNLPHCCMPLNAASQSVGQSCSPPNVVPQNTPSPCQAPGNVPKQIIPGMGPSQPCCPPISNQIRFQGKLPRHPLKNYRLSSDSDSSSFKSERVRKFSRTRKNNLKPRKKSVEVHSTLRASGNSNRQSDSKLLTSNKSEGQEKCNNSVPNQTTIRIQQTPVVQEPVPRPAPPKSCCMSSNPKLNHCCQKCLERYIEKQVALRLHKRVCRSTSQKRQSRPHCREEAPRSCATEFCKPRSCGCPQRLIQTQKCPAVPCANNSNCVPAYINQDTCSCQPAKIETICPSNKTLISVLVQSDEVPSCNRAAILMKPSTNVCVSNQTSNVAIRMESKAINVCQPAAKSYIDVSIQRSEIPNLCVSNQTSRVAVIMESKPINICPCPPTIKSHIDVSIQQKMSNVCVSNQTSKVAIKIESRPTHICQPPVKPHVDVSIMTHEVTNTCTSTLGSQVGIFVRSQSVLNLCPPKPTPDIEVKVVQSNIIKTCPPAPTPRIAVSVRSHTSQVISPCTNKTKSTVSIAIQSRSCGSIHPVPLCQSKSLMVMIPNIGISVSVPNIASERSICIDECVPDNNCPPTNECQPLQVVVQKRTIRTPVTQGYQIVPIKHRQHRIVKPSFSRIQGMAVNNTSDECVRRKHITFFKQHVPHQTIQNSEASCSLATPVTTIQTTECTQITTTGTSNATKDVETIHSDHYCPANLPHKNKKKTRHPKISAAAGHGCKKPNAPVLMVHASPCEVKAGQDKKHCRNATKNMNTFVFQHTEQQGCPRIERNDVGLKSSWHWEAKSTHHLTNHGESRVISSTAGHLFNHGQGQTDTFKTQVKIVENNSALERRGTKRRLSTHKHGV